MARATIDIDEQIERLRAGGTLTENEVKALCSKVRFDRHIQSGLSYVERSTVSTGGVKGSVAKW